MAIINSCLLFCCGPPAPIVLKAGDNMSVAYWAFIPALLPIRATAAHLFGPVEHVSGYVHSWPLCSSHWKPPWQQYSELLAGHICGQLCQLWEVFEACVIYPAEDLLWALPVNNINGQFGYRVIERLYMQWCHLINFYVLVIFLNCFFQGETISLQLISKIRVVCGNVNFSSSLLTDSK